MRAEQSSRDICGREYQPERGVTNIPLNLVTTYPVRWSRFKVLRELVQNFYDAVGREHWSKQFHLRRYGSAMKLEAEAVGFSYEWLLHIGASTKTDAAGGTFAGFFGEGFKIAALCAHRDYGWSITMASRDWELTVDSGTLTVDGTALRSLYYRVRQLERSEGTWLRLSPFSSSEERTLEAVLLSFYFPENPLLGECLWSDETTAVHLRSEQPKPQGYPETNDSRGPGIVFAGFQAMGSFELPLVIAKHDSRAKNRERDTFYRMDVIDTIHSAARIMPARVAAIVLEKMSRFWYQLPRCRYDFHSFYPVVRTLAGRVASEPEERKRWRERHPNLLVASRIGRSDLPAWNRRKQARAWLRTQSPRPRLVQDGFIRLGYLELETACEEADGFVVVRPAGVAKSTTS